MKLLLTAAYVGTNFHGYQAQPGLRTVQGTFQAALENLFAQKILLTGCSRTDAGVHANMFCMTAETIGDALFPAIPPEKLPLAISPLLPPDLTLLSAMRVDDDFHARYDVLYKQYVYLILNRPVRDPFYADRAWHCPTKLDIGLMNTACRYFIGKHDFSAFMAQGSKITSTVRDIKEFYVERDGDIVKISVSADGFLYNMVRILAGTLVSVSERKIEAESIPEIILSKDRRRAGATLPPQGLYLNRVVYRDGAFQNRSRE